MKHSYLSVLAFASVVLGQGVFVSQLNMNKCMDLYHKQIFPGNRVVIYDCDGSRTQEWIPVHTKPPVIQSGADTRYCIDGSDIPAPGVNVTIEYCNPRHASQHFLVPRGSGQISLSNTSPKLCIHVPDIINSTPLVFEVCQPKNPHQIWHVPAGRAGAGDGTDYGEY